MEETRPGKNLANVLWAWSNIVRTGSTNGLADILDPEVVWQGALPGSISRGRGEVLAVLADNPAPTLARIEVQELGDRVLLTMEGPDFPVTEGHLPGLRCRTFTLRDGRVCRIQTLGKHDFSADRDDPSGHKD